MNKNNQKMKPSLLLITQSFPFGIAESSFLKEEIKSLARNFNVHLISRNNKDTQYVNVPENVVLYRYHVKEQYNPLLLFLRTLFTYSFFEELISLVKKKKLSYNHIKVCIRVQMRTLHFSNYLQTIRNKINCPVILYSYWNDYACFAATRIKRKYDFVVSRLHGGDLYELDINDKYQPFKCVYNKDVDLFSFISRMGLSYFNETYFNVSRRASVNYLGVPEHPISYRFSNRQDVKIVSFSYVRDIKRIDKIVDVLSKVDGLRITWIHIGARYNYNEIRKYASEKLDGKSNVNYQFIGEMKNEGALRYISENEFDFLINVSSTEGMPMTMMEAFSMSIPVIGTKVGGVPEVVRHGYNGYLLDANFKDADLAHILYRYASLPFEEKKKLRTNAHNTWKTTFQDESNYRSFAHLLIKKFNLYEAK